MTDSALNNPIYKELGLRPVIHAAGTKTTYGGTRMQPEVLQAIAQASKSFVNIEALNRRIGAYIATVTGAEAGMVTSGAASGVVLSIAACMTNTDVAKIRQLPNSAGMKNELVIMKIHRGKYSHMYTFPGAQIIEVGNINDCCPEELEAAFTERTAAVAYLLGPGIPQTGLSLSEVTKIAHQVNIPVIVDAAAMLPPKDNLRRFIREGADLVTISGGKLIHGPQATGLLFGHRDLIEAALANANPNHAIGRPHKVSREDMVGLYTALKLYVDSDESLMLAAYRNRLQPISAALLNMQDLYVSIEHDDLRYHVPTLVVQFKPGWKGRDGAAITEAMLNGEPPIFILYDKSYNLLTINPISLQDGEAEIIARRLKEELERR